MGNVLRALGGGTGVPTLLLIHGMGATGDVWDGVQTLLPGRWPGRWLVPDLPGHGGSQPLDQYTFDALTAAVADEGSFHVPRMPSRFNYRGCFFCS